VGDFGRAILSGRLSTGEIARPEQFINDERGGIAAAIN
jgi:hypothetical protein